MGKISKCPICKELYSKSSKYCPHCGYEEQKSSFNSFIFPSFNGFFGFMRLIFLLFCIAIIFDIPGKFGFNTIGFISFLRQDTQLNKPLERNEQGNIIIPINSIVNLSGLSKDEVYRLRKQYVKESVIFSKIKKYEPNPNIFQIEDNLPWISAYQLAKYGVINNSSIGMGESSVSISIVNPDLLFSFLIPSYNRINEDAFSEYDYLFPTSLEWDDKNNIIIAKYPISEFRKRNRYFNNIEYSLNETNARDFGYNWILCSEYKNIAFHNPYYNISTAIYEPQGFYHKGYSCGLASGCNNYSPDQEKMNFKMLNDYGEMTIKLWKEKPSSMFDEADIIFKLIFI